MEMTDGMRVMVKLKSFKKPPEDEFEWFEGTVVRQRKQWVELDSEPHKPVVDENEILEWHEIVEEPVSGG